MKLLLLLAGILSAQASFAITNESCEDAGITFNAVKEMKTYSNGQIKVFSADRIEPAAASWGVIVTLDRGQSEAEYESFCRYISGLSDVRLSGIAASYDAPSNSLTVLIPVRHTNDGNTYRDRTLNVLVTKGAKREKDIVRATLN